MIVDMLKGSSFSQDTSQYNNLYTKHHGWVPLVHLEQSGMWTGMGTYYECAYMFRHRRGHRHSAETH